MTCGQRPSQIAIWKVVTQMSEVWIYHYKKYLDIPLKMITIYEGNYMFKYLNISLKMITIYEDNNMFKCTLYKDAARWTRTVDRQKLNPTSKTGSEIN